MKSVKNICTFVVECVAEACSRGMFIVQYKKAVLMERRGDPIMLNQETACWVRTLHFLIAYNEKQQGYGKMSPARFRTYKTILEDGFVTKEFVKFQNMKKKMVKKHKNTTIIDEKIQALHRLQIFLESILSADQVRELEERAKEMYPTVYANFHLV